MGTIYQTINLYKRNIPFEEGDMDSHGYYTFGHFDALDIWEKQPTLKDLWEDYLKKDLLQSSYASSQPIFLSRDSRWRLQDDYCEIEANNTQINEVYPFIFVALLNRRSPKRIDNEYAEMLINGDMINDVGPGIGASEWLAWMNGICKCLGGKYTDLNKDRAYRFACYYPLNISQAAIIFYSNEYYTIVNLLAYLQRSFKEHTEVSSLEKDKDADKKIKSNDDKGNQPIQYSFTISGIRNDWIKDDNKRIRDQNNYTVFMDIVAKDPEYFYLFISQLNETFNPKEIDLVSFGSELIGSADVRLTYQEISMEDILTALRKIIRSQNINYCKGVASLMTGIACPICIISNPSHALDIQRLNLFQRPNQEYLNGDRRLIYKLVDSVEKLEQSPFMHYIQFIIKPVITVLLEINNQFNENDNKHELISVFDRDFKSLLTNIQSLFLSTLRADRQFFEAPGYNMLLDETPLKLIALYHGCFYELRALLNDQEEKRRYAFLIYPDMTGTMKAFSFFLLPKVSSRIFCILLPWGAVMNIRMILPPLAHELSHFIANKARNRQQRYYKVLELISRMIVSEIYPYKSEKFVEEFKSEIDKYISGRMPSDEKYYSYNLSHELLFAVEELLKSEDFQYKMWVVYTEHECFRTQTIDNEGFLTINQWNEMEKFERESYFNKIYLMDSNRKGMNHAQIIDFALGMARECFADIVMIISLKMSYEEYLLNFYEANIRPEDLTDISLLKRISEVVKVMIEHKYWIVSDDILQQEQRKNGYSQEEWKTIGQFHLLLKQDLNDTLEEMIDKTVHQYLMNCMSTLKTQPIFRNDSLTEKIYHDTFCDYLKSDSVNLIQSLLWRLGQEV